jgi:hypothetical protein
MVVTEKGARKGALRVLTALVIFTAATSARADAQAEEYFQLGKAAMARGEYAKACPLFEASKKLEDTLGTLLNLADCHQQAGKVATAWGEFIEAEQRARAAKKDERAVFAHDRAEVLRKKLPRMKLRISPAARVEGLEIRVDGKAVPPEAWDVGVPVDPGKRNVAVSAPGKLPQSVFTTVDPVEGEALVVPVDIPVLKDAPKSAPPPSSGPTDAAEIEAVASARARRTAGYVVSGIGIAGLAVGGVFGGLGLSAMSDERNACKAKTCFNDGLPGDTYQKAADARTAAVTDINVAAIGGGVGLCALGVGIYLLATSSPKLPAKTAIAPSVGPGHQGVTILGEF